MYDVNIASATIKIYSLFNMKTSDVHSYCTISLPPVTLTEKPENFDYKKCILKNWCETIEWDITESKRATKKVFQS